MKVAVIESAWTALWQTVIGQNFEPQCANGLKRRSCGHDKGVFVRPCAADQPRSVGLTSKDGALGFGDARDIDYIKRLPGTLASLQVFGRSSDFLLGIRRIEPGYRLRRTQMSARFRASSSWRRTCVWGLTSNGRSARSTPAKTACSP